MNKLSEIYNGTRMVIILKNTIFWCVTPCSFVNVANIYQELTNSIFSSNLKTETASSSATQFKFQMDWPFSLHARRRAHTHTHTTFVIAVKHQSHVRKNPPFDIPCLDVCTVSLRTPSTLHPTQTSIFHLITNLSEL
jgi:hypothetical protein